MNKTLKELMDELRQKDPNSYFLIEENVRLRLENIKMKNFIDVQAQIKLHFAPKNI